MARLQARLNTARLAATRLGDYFPGLTLHINSLASWRHGGAQGVMVDPSLTIAEAEGDVPSTASFELRDATSPPQQGQAIYIGLGSADHRIFGGQIIRVEQAQSRYVEQPVWSVECEDSHRLLNRRLVTAQFSAMQAGDIIQALVSSYTSGFTATHVQAAMGSVDYIEFTRETVAKAITRTLNRVGGRWRLDPYNDVRAWVGSEVGQSPSADLSATGKHWDWHHEWDITQIRTKVFVFGAAASASARVLPNGAPVFVDSNERLQGASTLQINRAFYEVTSVSPFVAGPAYFLVLASSISGNGFGGCEVGDPVTVVGIAQSVTYQNSIAAIEGGDGIHEYAIVDGRLTHAGALQRAQAELTIFGTIEHRGSYVTRDPGATTGRLVAINVASPTHVSSVSARIQRVSVSKFEESSRAWNTTRTHLFPQRKVTYSSAAVRDTFDILGDFERGD